MCDFCHAGPEQPHRLACPIPGAMPAPPAPPERDPILDERADLRLAIRVARRAVERHPRQDPTGRIVAQIRRDMMRP
jgi:hypothetical protein